MDLVEMGLVPAAVLGDCPADGVCVDIQNDVQELWKKLCGEGKVEKVEILKRGKVIGLDKIRQFTGDGLYPVQTQYTDYNI